MSGDLVAVWEVALSDGVHRIEFEHGTTTGKRVIHIDGKVKYSFQMIFLSNCTTQDNSILVEFPYFQIEFSKINKQMHPVCCHFRLPVYSEP